MAEKSEWRKAPAKIAIGVATVVLGAAALAIGAHFLDLWPKIWTGIGAVLGYAFSDWTLHWWQFLPMAITSLGFVFLVLYLLRRSLKIWSEKSSLYAVTEAVYEGVLWTWDWDQLGEAYGITPRCPMPGCRMELVSEFHHFGGQHDYYRCEVCRYTSPEVRGGLREGRRRVHRLIERDLELRKMGQPAALPEPDDDPE